MSLATRILGGAGRSYVRVTKRGQLVVSELDYSEFYTARTTVANTPVNLIRPRAGKNFIITALILSGDRNIGQNGAITDIYENETGPTNATITKRIYQDEIAKQTRAVLLSLNIIVPEGRWVNAKSDDIQVRVNLAGYYIPAIPVGQPLA